MARKVETIVTLTDDLDGGKADRTVSFSYDGTEYEIDLSKRNATAFEKVLGPYVGAGRRVSARRRAANGRAGSRGARAGKTRTDLSEVREWARANGYEVSDRGRVPAEVVDAYDAR